MSGARVPTIALDQLYSPSFASQPVLNDREGSAQDVTGLRTCSISDHTRAGVYSKTHSLRNTGAVTMAWEGLLSLPACLQQSLAGAVG